VADLDAAAIVRDALAEHAALAQRLTEPELVSAVARVAELLVDTYARGGKMLVFGNGGSAAEAAHLAAEMVGRCGRDRRTPTVRCALRRGVVAFLFHIKRLI